MAVRAGEGAQQAGGHPGGWQQGLAVTSRVTGMAARAGQQSWGVAAGAGGHPGGSSSGWGVAAGSGVTAGVAAGMEGGSRGRGVAAGAGGHLGGGSRGWRVVAGARGWQQRWVSPRGCPGTGRGGQDRSGVSEPRPAGSDPSRSHAARPSPGMAKPSPPPPVRPVPSRSAAAHPRDRPGTPPPPPAAGAPPAPTGSSAGPAGAALPLPQEEPGRGEGPAPAPPTGEPAPPTGEPAPASPLRGKPLPRLKTTPPHTHTPQPLLVPRRGRKGTPPTPTARPTRRGETSPRDHRDPFRTTGTSPPWLPGMTPPSWGSGASRLPPQAPQTSLLIPHLPRLPTFLCPRPGIPRTPRPSPSPKCNHTTTTTRGGVNPFPAPAQEKTRLGVSHSSRLGRGRSPQCRGGAAEPPQTLYLGEGGGDVAVTGTGNRPGCWRRSQPPTYRRC